MPSGGGTKFTDDAGVAARAAGGQRFVEQRRGVIDAGRNGGGGKFLQADRGRDAVEVGARSGRRSRLAVNRDDDIATQQRRSLRLGADAGKR